MPNRLGRTDFGLILYTLIQIDRLHIGCMTDFAEVKITMLSTPYRQLIVQILVSLVIPCGKLLKLFVIVF